MSIARLRQEYHDRICQEVIRIRQDKAKNLEYPNTADSGNKNSIKIAWGMVERLGCPKNYAGVSEQTIGGRFEKITNDFLSGAFQLLHHLRPGRWLYSTTQTAISGFDQYEHFGYLEKIIKPDRALASALGKGDLDCVYHFALDELKEAISDLDNQDQMDMLEMLIEGRRLRDISDLPFDLAI